MIVVKGTNMQANPTIRHGNNVFSKYTIDTPKDVPRLVYVIRTPRIDGSLFDWKVKGKLYFALQIKRISMLKSNPTEKIHNFQKRNVQNSPNFSDLKGWKFGRKKIFKNQIIHSNS